MTKTVWSSLLLREFLFHRSGEQHRPLRSLALPMYKNPRQKTQHAPPQGATNNLSHPHAQLKRRNQQHRKRID
ncbi:hypothetical protein BDR07DRAFT_1407424 [Suillus spraguei]|nr:hypothetical protein BDR07DRAFT_1436555 [Suillus spraguei]KAG2362255.1 hypothetical protein BDR07DRAFT_1407424 [Suillus spraguei]